jgi:feruloyl esterase
LKKAFAGPKGIYPGFPYDAGIDDQSFIPGLLRKVVIPVAPPSLRTEYDTEKAAADLAADANSRLGDTTATKLSTFSGHGGKLLFYHGLSDPWFSPLDTLGYYEKMSRENGGAEGVQSWSRLYLVPGMGHCGGGSATLDSFDMLSAVTDWVEKGTAPDEVIATGKAFPGRSRPLCAYPKHAQYSGQGDPNDAKNFGCRK